MADITIVCPTCDTKCTLSEYAVPENLTCRVCGAALRKPVSESAFKLRVKKDGMATRASEKPDLVLTDVTTAVQPPPSTIGDAHKVRGHKPKHQKMVWGWLLFVVLGSLWIGAQIYVSQNPAYLSWYLWGRTGLLCVVMLIVLIVAFDDSYAQGFLCLMVPAYILYYATSRVESALLRGAFLAVVVSLGAELHFIKTESFVVISQRNINRFIDSVGQMINDAGAKPVDRL